MDYHNRPEEGAYAMTKLDAGRDTDRNKLLSLSTRDIGYYLNLYEAAIRNKSEKSAGSGKVKAKDESLEVLDSWYQSLAHRTANDVDSSSSDADFVSKPTEISCKADLIRLMRWKLAREKFRPTLMSLIQSNPEPQVQNVLQRAYTSCVLIDTKDRDAAPALIAVMKVLAELRGVGPATASAITAAWHPLGIFQSDELVSLLLPRSQIKYDWKFYTTFYHVASETLHELRTSYNPQMSGRQLEQIAWSMAHSQDPKPVTASTESGEVTATELEDVVPTNAADKRPKLKKATLSPPNPTARPKRTRLTHSTHA